MKWLARLRRRLLGTGDDDPPEDSSPAACALYVAREVAAIVRDGPHGDACRALERAAPDPQFCKVEQYSYSLALARWVLLRKHQVDSGPYLDISRAATHSFLAGALKRGFRSLPADRQLLMIVNFEDRVSHYHEALRTRPAHEVGAGVLAPHVGVEDPAVKAKLAASFQPTTEHLARRFERLPGAGDREPETGSREP